LKIFGGRSRVKIMLANEAWQIIRKFECNVEQIRSNPQYFQDFELDTRDRPQTRDWLLG
jgi:hypothetical protein